MSTNADKHPIDMNELCALAKSKATTKTMTRARRQKLLHQIARIVTTFDEIDLALTLQLVRSVGQAPRWSKLHQREELRGGVR